LVVDARVDDFEAYSFDDENDNLYDYVGDFSTKENSTVASASTRVFTSKSMEEENEFSAEDILEDVCILLCVSDGYLNMKNYGNTTLAIRGPFIIKQVHLSLLQMRMVKK